MGDHQQLGLAACFSLDEYDRDIIKKHERTRRDKEDDRTRHMLALGAQTGPVFLTYRATADVTTSRRGALKTTRCSISPPPTASSTPSGASADPIAWRSSTRSRALPRCTSPTGIIAPRVPPAHGPKFLTAAISAQSLGDGADFDTFLAVAFPHDQVQILPYNRIVKDLGGLTEHDFMHAVHERFTVQAGPPAPQQRGDIAMYFHRHWQTLRPKVAPDRRNAIASLDVSVLQDSLLAPILKIADIRTDKRIDFVGGARGTSELEKHVNSGKAAVAFSLYPVGVDELMAVSDADDIMPPKSTWFEPKLRDGLLIHVI